MFEDIKKAQLVEKIRVMAATGQSGEEIKKSLSKEELDLMKSFSNDIEKGKAAQVGEIRVWQGKKMRKQSNGKWVEVSESGMSKKEHLESLKRSQDIEREYERQGSKTPLHHKQEINTQLSASSKLSDKEYDESELEGSNLVDKVANHYNVSREKVSKLKLDGTDTPLELSRVLGLNLNDTNFSGVNDTIKKLSGKNKDLENKIEKLYNKGVDVYIDKDTGEHMYIAMKGDGTYGAYDINDNLIASERKRSDITSSYNLEPVKSIKNKDLENKLSELIDKENFYEKVAEHFGEPDDDGESESALIDRILSHGEEKVKKFIDSLK